MTLSKTFGQNVDYINMNNIFYNLVTSHNNKIQQVIHIIIIKIRKPDKNTNTLIYTIAIM